MYKDNFSSSARNRVEIQKYTTVDDGYGGQTITWDTQDKLPKVWAIIKPISGNERFSNNELQSTVTHKVTIRYQTQLKDTQDTATYRLKHDDRYFSIKAIRNLHSDLKTEGKAFQVLLCEENAPEHD